MLDFILGLFLAGLLVRGWVRGFVREILDLIGLVVGIWIAFRMSGPVGEFLADRFDVAPEVATIGAGVVLFVLFGVSLSVAAHYLSKIMRLPGLNLANRFGGSAVAIAWGMALVAVLSSIVQVFPIGERLEASIEESSVVEAIAGPDALPRSMLESIAPENVLGSIQSLRSLFGETRAVPEEDEVLAIPVAPSDEVRQVRGDASKVAAWVNEFRAGEGLGALQESEVLTKVAEDRAIEMYVSGRLSRIDTSGRSAAVYLADVGVRLVATGENLALASSARAAYEGMLDSTSGLAQLTLSAYDRAGVAVVDGPTGRLVVIVFGG